MWQVVAVAVAVAVGLRAGPLEGKRNSAENADQLVEIINPGFLVHLDPSETEARANPRRTFRLIILIHSLLTANPSTNSSFPRIIHRSTHINSISSLRYPSSTLLYRYLVPKRAERNVCSRIRVPQFRLEG